MDLITFIDNDRDYIPYTPHRNTTEVDGVTWVEVEDGSGCPFWLRLVDGEEKGDVMIFRHFGWKYDLPNPEFDLDYVDQSDSSLIAQYGEEDYAEYTLGYPVVYRGYDWTEYDVEFGETFGTFEQAARAATAPEAYRPANLR